MLPACEDAHHMWIVTQQSYIIRPFTSSLSLAGTPADAPTCSAAANGNSRLGTTLLAPSGESWPKAAASFLRGQGYKTVSRFSLFKNNWPLRPFLFTRRPPPVTQGVGAEGFAGVVVVWRGGRKGKERSIFGIATLRYHLLLLQKQSYTYAEYIEKGDIMKSAKS